MMEWEQHAQLLTINKPFQFSLPFDWKMPADQFVYLLLQMLFQSSYNITGISIKYF
jgi:hypothetical protein